MTPNEFRVAPSVTQDLTLRSPSAVPMRTRTIRPFAVSHLRGLVWHGDTLFGLDFVSGRVIQIDPETDDTTVVNNENAGSFAGATGLAVSDGRLWFAASDGVFWTRLSRATVGGRTVHTSTGRAECFLRRDDVEAVTVDEDHVWVVTTPDARIPGQTRQLLTVDRATGKVLSTRHLRGIGPKNLALSDDYIWVSDMGEQSVYALDRRTGEELFVVVTPLEGPTAIAARPSAAPALPGTTAEELAARAWDDILVAYYEEEPFIKDNPWRDPCWELRYRDRTLVHPLSTHFDPDLRRAYSNGFLIEMSYVAESEPIENDMHIDVQWRMALPIDTARQRVLAVEPIGRSFERIEVDGKPVVEFRFDEFGPKTKHVFGWRALVEVWGIKHLYSAADCADLGEAGPEFGKYLLDDDYLSMDTPVIQHAAREAVGDAVDVRTKLHRIRNYVYDKLSYEMGNSDRPDKVLRRGTGSCGEYLGLLLALCRLNGIATRTAGRYKCLYQPWSRDVPLYPDFNHVWLDAYLPGLGWVPIESNPDDVTEGGPYPDRFFMGLPWRHFEMAKDIPFEDVLTSGGTDYASPGVLSYNHIQFRILQELAPATVRSDDATGSN